ncbi:hypothetical protein Cgig2_016163 [Carnegiea gigantea]|uniref:Rho GTPase-activating protein 7 n=1 Tax=Carnegiea gigantea TaxID=171969 RepID=A0A9Q1KQ54_9CARY|nr:hypothetical protein Cgig2_016163 [Carnegiea gigantea]
MFSSCYRIGLEILEEALSAIPQKGVEVNLTLGGIDLNNSGSVVVREDKKLLTVLFPDGRDGRAFTLKAETLEDLYEWKTALEQALEQAPSAALVMGHNGIFQNDTSDAIDGSFHLCPWVKVEGILRQSADVEEVERRVRDYEQGKNEFGMDEDADVVGDCVKHVLRELPSSPVPASCCTALLEAYKIDSKEARVRAMRLAILDALPEPNQRLLQRVLKMMHIIASYSSDNLMSSSAVAACMAPLLLRPLLAGECEFDDDFDMACDNSTQLLAAANAASNAQAIIATLLEEYENIFDIVLLFEFDMFIRLDYVLQRCSISADSHIENSENDDPTDDESVDVKEKGYHDGGNEADRERDNDQTDDDQEWTLGGKMSESNGYAGSKLYGYKAFGADESDGSPHANRASSVSSKAFSNPQTFQKYDPQLSDGSKPVKLSRSLIDVMESPMPPGEFYGSMGEIPSSMDPGPPMPVPWKSPSVEPIDSSGEEELAIQRLVTIKNDLRHQIANEVRGNAALQASLERRKHAVHEHRLALEQDIQRLQKQLQAEKDLRAALEVGLSMSPGQLSGSYGMDPKIRAELEEIALAEADVARLKQKVAELHCQLNLQRRHHFGLLSDTSVRGLLRQNFDSTLAFCTYERKQGNEMPEAAQGSLANNLCSQPVRLVRKVLNHHVILSPCLALPGVRFSQTYVYGNVNTTRVNHPAGLLQGTAISTHAAAAQPRLELWHITGLFAQTITTFMELT